MSFKLSQVNRPFIIAELSANHNGKISNIFKLIDKAKKCGANAIKIQSYTPHSMTIDCKNKYFYINRGPWKGNYLFDLYKKGTTPFSWHKKIFDYAKKKRILCFSTPFDIAAVDLLEKLKVKLYKIASFEINHIPLLERIGKTKKPVIISTGMADINDVSLAIKTLKKNGTKDIAILHCISSYPSKPDDYNLNFIDRLKQFNFPIGLSDHTVGSITAITSVGKGVKIFEKHMKLYAKQGIDSKFSTDPYDFKNYVNDINLSFKCIGQENFNRKIFEGDNKRYRRSIFVSKNVHKNDVITKENIIVIRPSNGMHPKYYKKMLGKKFKKNIKKGIPLSFDHIS
jgi:pseudaminic acid synthase